MSANKRTRAQRELDLEKIADLHHQGKSQSEIALELGVSQPQVSKDLEKLEHLWKNAIDKWDFHKAREVARINALERKYLLAWARSQAERTVTKIKQTKTPKGGIDETEVRTENRDGNPAFLAGVLACIAERCKLLGLYPLTGNSIEAALGRMPPELGDLVRRILAGEFQAG